jgi:Trypsin-co-occurring domain 1
MPMTNHVDLDSPQILVEFPQRAGRQQVARLPADTARESAAALARSLSTIQGMAARLTAAMDALGDACPKELELSFGIKFDTEVGAIIAKTGVEGSLAVKLVWKRSAEE